MYLYEQEIYIVKMFSKSKGFLVSVINVIVTVLKVQEMMIS
jgi:hypothetical protein